MIRPRAVKMSSASDDLELGGEMSSDDPDLVFRGSLVV